MPTLTRTLDEQIRALAELTEKTRQLLLTSGRTLPQQLIEPIDRLTRDLDRLRVQITQRKAEQENMLALAEVGQVVNSSLELDEVLKIVMDTIVRLTRAERGFLMLRDENGVLTTRIARDWEQESLDRSEWAVSRTVINRVAAEGQPVVTTNAQEDPRFGGQDSIVFYNLRSILCVPLKVKDELTGVIYADNRIRTGIFTAAERDLLAAFANHAAVAIENARLFASVRRTLAEVTELKHLTDNVFASITSGVITTGCEEQILLANRAALEILGCSPSDLVGRKLGEALPALSLLSQPLTSAQERAASTVGLEIHPVLPGRGQAALRFSLSPLKDAQQETQGVVIVVDDLTEQKRLEGQRRLFERMVSPAVIRQLDPEALQLGGKRVQITSMFADIRGFTSFSEQLDPEQLVSVLNRYLAAAAEAVLEQEGTVDKFLGDAVMAWFNAPIPQPDHAQRAVRAALRIRQTVQKLHRDLPPALRLAFGIGIHTGEAVLGLIGTEKRLEYTAIGDSVNSAKRIQENASDNQILVSAAVLPLLDDAPCNDAPWDDGPFHGGISLRRVGPLQVKGKRQPIEVYEVTG